MCFCLEATFVKGRIEKGKLNYALGCLCDTMNVTYILAVLLALNRANLILMHVLLVYVKTNLDVYSKNIKGIMYTAQNVYYPTNKHRERNQHFIVPRSP